jgi:hypothetical protein
MIVNSMVVTVKIPLMAAPEMTSYMVVRTTTRLMEMLTTTHLKVAEAPILATVEPVQIP